MSWASIDAGIIEGWRHSHSFWHSSRSFSAFWRSADRQNAENDRDECQNECECLHPSMIPASIDAHDMSTGPSILQVTPIGGSRVQTTQLGHRRNRTNLVALRRLHHPDRKRHRGSRAQSHAGGLLRATEHVTHGAAFGPGDAVGEERRDSSCSGDAPIEWSEHGILRSV